MSWHLIATPEAMVFLAGLAAMPPPKFTAALTIGSVPTAFAFAAIGACSADQPILAPAGASSAANGDIPNSAALAGKVSGHYAFRKTPEFRRPFKGDVQWRHLRVRILRPQPRSPSLRAQLAFQGYMHIPAARLPQLNKKREAEEGGGSEAFRPALIAEP
jgi:hypothetical protein